MRHSSAGDPPDRRVVERVRELERLGPGESRREGGPRDLCEDGAEDSGQGGGSKVPAVRFVRPVDVCCLALVGICVMAEQESVVADVTVRAFRAGDRAELVALWTTVFPDDPPWNAPARMIDTKLGVQPELLLVAVRDTKLVGAVIAGFDGVRGWLYHLAVLPEWRRRGIATALVRAGERGLAALGCSKVNLQVRATNSEVIAFYRSLGYSVEERASMGRRLG